MDELAGPDPRGDRWTGHVVVCGLHPEGLRVVEQLSAAGVPVVVVDARPDPVLVRSVEAWGVPLVTGDPRLPDVLAAAGLAGASALVCLEADDLHTLATALLAREEAPGVRVVVQLRNPAVGRALAATGVAVLDVARLSAPAVVEACLRTGVHPLRLGGQEFVVVETECTAPGTLRELYGDLAPLAVVRAGTAHGELSPPRDRLLAAGDRAVVVGTPEEVERAGLEHRRAVAPGAGSRRAGGADGPPAFVGARAYRPPRHRPASVLTTVARSLDRRLRLALLALFTLAATSVAVLVIGYRGPHGYRMSVVDAVYFTVETIGTVGFGDFSFREQETWLRLWAITLMVVGGILATTFFALLTNTLVSRRLEETLGRRRVSGLAEHVVVVGLGSIGLEVVARLRARGAGVVVVESDPENRFLDRARSLGARVVVADATSPEVLRSVQLERALAVAVVTSDDLANIETGLAVRDVLGERWAEVPVVLRVFDRRLATTLEATLDFHYVRSTAALAAPWFVGAALGLDVLSTLYVADAPMLVARLTVTGGGGLDGLAMRELPTDVRVVVLRRRGSGVDEHPPRRETRLAAGDVAHLIGPYEELIALLRRDATVAARSTGTDTDTDTDTDDREELLS